MQAADRLRFLFEDDLLDDTSRAAVESRISDEIESDLRYALDSPFPAPETAIQGVYARTLSGG